MLIIAVFMILLFGRLFILTVLQQEQWTEAAENISTKSIYTPGERGDIFDRYGRLLAGNITSFTVQFSMDDTDGESLNKTASALVRILEENGETLVDNLPVLYEGGVFFYSYQKEIESWLLSQGMPADFSAEQAFDEIRRRNNIDEGMDQFAAQEQLINLYGVTAPISVKRMKFSKSIEQDNFLERYNLDISLSPQEAFLALRKIFKIDPALPAEEARKIMVIRNELNSQGYRKYLPAAVATNISDNTVLILEERSGDLPGINVVTDSIRYYPNDNLASHVLGYMGKISESDKEHYVNDLSYRPNDMIGLDGIERSEESTLRGRDGIREVQVNANGELVKVISEIPAAKGKDLYLTIDAELQKVAEDALSQALTQIQVGGVFRSEWGNFSFNTPYPNASVGAAVALDVKSGEPLAIANAPNFNPNAFARGISSEEWTALQGQNLRDPLSPLPLYNVAARTAVQPGSTFKMVTATAALEAGLNAAAKLRDGGAVKIGNRTYGCLLWNRSRGSHGYLNLYEAMEVSCNYYFFDIATGRDFDRNTYLGYKTPINIDVITSYAEQFGLGVPTGVEIPETVVGVPTSEKKIANTKAMLRNYLINRSEMYFTENVLEDRSLLMNDIDKIVSWTEENPNRAQLAERLKVTGIRPDMVEDVANVCKYTYYNYAEWTTGDELNIAIGQGENAYTPLQMANYIATIGNGGVRNKLSLKKAVEGQGVIEKEAGQKLDISDPSILDHIVKGMRQVVSGAKGSLRANFAGFPVSVAGKTGTAQRDGRINPPDEVEFVKSNLHRIDAALAWEDVEAEMFRVMEKYPDIYSSKNLAVRKAVANLSKYKNAVERIDMYKPEYENFAWVVAMAPAEDPQIAVAVLIFQGGTSANAAPVAKEIIAKYMELEKTYGDYSMGNVIK
jgi:penicillin-binding protein 2